MLCVFVCSFFSSCASLINLHHFSKSVARSQSVDKLHSKFCFGGVFDLNLLKG